MENDGGLGDSLWGPHSLLHGSLPGWAAWGSLGLKTPTLLVLQNPCQESLGLCIFHDSNGAIPEYHTIPTWGCLWMKPCSSAMPTPEWTLQYQYVIVITTFLTPLDQCKRYNLINGLLGSLTCISWHTKRKYRINFFLTHATVKRMEYLPFRWNHLLSWGFLLVVFPFCLTPVRLSY